MDSLYIRNEIFVAASPERLWNVLTQPDETPKYMFGCRTVSDWQLGSKLEWVMPIEGEDTAVVVGHIEELVPAVKLKYTVFDPFAGYEDVRANYLEVIYELQAKDGGTLLLVSQGDFAKVENGQKRYEDSDGAGQGWMPILEQIKRLAEQG